MNYTMVYLKWEACLVHGYMGYRDYNACGGGARGSGEGGGGERDPRLQEAADSRATARYRVGVPFRVHISYLRSRTRDYTRAHASTN